MNFVYRLWGSEFEWDFSKAQSNIEKHGITFEEAAEVFFDPFFQGGDATVDQELRSFMLGYSSRQKLLLVVYIDRNQRSRIISARLATRQERRLYESN